jgi:hypothetical protein
MPDDFVKHHHTISKLSDEAMKEDDVSHRLFLSTVFLQTRESVDTVQVQYTVVGALTW